ncbi:MAG: hypothetical protein WCY92_11755 [Novosphingobium sp.]
MASQPDNTSLPSEIDFQTDRRASPERMNRAMLWLYAQLRIAQAQAKSYEVAINELRALGLERVTEALTPVFVQAQEIGQALEAIHDQWADEELILANHYTKPEIDLSFAAIDAALGSKLDKSGDIVTGTITFNSEADGPSIRMPKGDWPAEPVDGDIIRPNDHPPYIRTGNAWHQFCIGNITQEFQNKSFNTVTLKGTISVDTGPKSKIYNIADADNFPVNPANGPIQTITFTANRTADLSPITEGRAVELRVDDGTGWLGSFPVDEWETDGGQAPQLKSDGYTAILFRKIGGVLYGARLGDGG